MSAPWTRTEAGGSTQISAVRVVEYEDARDLAEERGEGVEQHEALVWPGRRAASGSQGRTRQHRRERRAPDRPDASPHGARDHPRTADDRGVHYGVRRAVLWVALSSGCGPPPTADTDPTTGNTGATTSTDAGTTAEATGATTTGTAETTTPPTDPTDATDDAGTTGTPLPRCRPPEPPPAGFHVAVDGSPGGDGSLGAPWDLATALDHPAAVAPGDTLYLHGGVYQGTFVAKLEGARGARITVRSYPGEWAVIDGASPDEVVLQVYRPWATFRDFELMNSDPTRFGPKRPSGIYVEAGELQFINLVIHDVGTGLIGNSATADAPEPSPGLELYGTVMFNNGWEDDSRGHGHHVYLQNRDGTKRVRDNILLHAFGFGLHAYSETDTYWIRGFWVEGNAWFQNGAGSAGDSKLYDGCLIGHNGTNPVGDVTPARELRLGGVARRARHPARVERAQ